MVDDLYQISDRQLDGARLNGTVNYNPEHQVFKGHFPGQPVVPGVCTMDMIKDLLQEVLGKKLVLRSTGQVKFLQLIVPDRKPTVNITWQEVENGYLANAGLKENGTDLFKMTGTFEVVS